MDISAVVLLVDTSDVFVDELRLISGGLNASGLGDESWH